MHRACHDNDIRRHQFVFEKVYVPVGIYAGIVIAALAAPETASPDIHVMEIDQLNGTGKILQEPVGHRRKIG